MLVQNQFFALSSFNLHLFTFPWAYTRSNDVPLLGLSIRLQQIHVFIARAQLYAELTAVLTLVD